MADNEEDVATKAPESDAHEPSMLSAEDTPAQKGASMGVLMVSIDCIIRHTKVKL